MTEFFSRLKKISDQLGACGQPVSEKLQIRILLAGVGTEYDSVVSSVTAMPASFSLRDVQALLLNQNQRLSANVTQAASEVQHTTNVAAGPNLNNNGFGGRGDGNLGGGGRGSGRGRGRLFCQLRRTPGHTPAYWFKRFDRSFQPQLQGQQQQQASQFNRT